uniref:Uncharacterized protein n=1 Tax=Romanomermis culicivorax TaxID=13658 RepID=A0A915LAS2_ROMCU
MTLEKQNNPLKSNNKVERWWLELNNRVNYPIKHCLVDLEIRELADRTIPHHLLSIGYLIRQIAAYDSSLAVGAWNAHIISGHGSPSSHIASNRAVPIETPSATQAAQMYWNAGGRLTEEHDVGVDLLQGARHLARQRHENFWTQMIHYFPDFNIPYLFSCTVNHNYLPLQRSVLLHIYISEQLCNRFVNAP